MAVPPILLLACCYVVSGRFLGVVKENLSDPPTQVAIPAEDDNDDDLSDAFSFSGRCRSNVTAPGTVSAASATKDSVSGVSARADVSTSDLCVLDSPRAPESGRPNALRPPPEWSDQWNQWYTFQGNRAGALPAHPLRQHPPGPYFTSLVKEKQGHRAFAMCTIPRNGCSRWRRLLRRVEGFPNYLSKDPHNRATNGLGYVDQIPPQAQVNFWSTPKYFKIFIARNPLERALSAYLSKQEAHHLPPTFGKFVQTFGKKRKWPNLDAHWRPQTSLCHSPDEFHYDFIARVEDRNVWMPRLFKMLHLEPFVNSGWGVNQVGTFSGAEDQTGSVTTDATRVKVLRQHFNPNLFRRSMCYYKKDISVLGYEKDVKGLWRAMYPAQVPPTLLKACR